MIIYSKNIVLFIHEIKSAIKSILSSEIGLRVLGDRFYDKQQRASYPIHVVIYNTKSMLGYFDPNFYELGFHECLMYSSKEQLHNVIRHELAHYLSFISYGEAIQPHGTEFKAFCRSMGWSAEVEKAAICLESEEGTYKHEESNIFRKIKKLMALSTSCNPHEAELAMIKSQQLLLKHNLESNLFENDDEEKICLKRILKQKKENAKMRSIAKILETFFVSSVYCRTGDFIYLEILGSAVNVEIAEYVASILHSELDKLWDLARRQAGLKGLIAKNSFLLGLAKGYCNKIQALKKECHTDSGQGLMIIEKKLMDAKELIYKRLSQRKSSSSCCHASSSLGEKMGRQLNINPAIKESAKNSQACIAYSD
jgi:predicted SprT family Zn-dependent metalloprotease